MTTTAIAATETAQTDELTAKVLELVRQKFSAYIEAGYEGPWIMTEDNSFTGGTNVICWEEGPYEWAYELSGEHAVEGALLEPYNSFALVVVDER